jgi:dienelactone hydrolase
VRTGRGVALLLVAVAAAFPALRHDGARAQPDLAPAELGPLVAGEAALVDGTFVWTDYAYDDSGTEYPADRRNAADLVQVQLRQVPGGVRVRVVLETLTDAEVPRLTLAFDTDRNGATGAPALAGWDWVPAAPLGVDAVFELSSATPGAVVDPVRNVVEATLPTDPGRATWRAYLVAGLTGERVVNDLAFVGAEGASGWQDARQLQVLAGELDPAAAAAEVDFGTQGTRLPDIRRPGFHTFLYRSALPLAEGIGQVVVQGPGGTPVPLGDRYDGPYQPYLVWVPEQLPAASPVVVFMHGFSGNHTSLADALGPGRLAPAAVVAMPLGRGGNAFYLGPGEQDVLDVVDDVVRRFAGDPDRVVLSGVSMGGFGTFRLGVRYPDRWSAMVPLIGTGASMQSTGEPVPPAVRDPLFSPSHFLGGQSELLANVLNVPVRMVNGQLDPIVNNGFVTGDVVRLDALGYDYRYWVLGRRHHEVVPEVTHCVLADMVARRRPTAPARVVLTVEPSTFYVEPGEGLDLRYDRAYWVSGVAVRDADEPGAMGTVDAVSLARADRVPATEQVQRAGSNLAEGADLCGPNPDVHTDDVWREQGIIWSAGAVQPVANGVSVALARVEAATLDLGTAGVRVDEAVTVDVTGDGPTALRLAAPWPGPVAVERDGAALGTFPPVGGAVVLESDLDGHHTYRLVPAGTATPSAVAPQVKGASTGPRTLPATGGYGPAAGLAALAAALVATGLSRRPWSRRPRRPASPSRRGARPPRGWPRSSGDRTGPRTARSGRRRTGSARPGSPCPRP